jgi:FkbM family methyltransferase
MKALRIRRLARVYRATPVAQTIARFCEKFLHGYYNQGFLDLALNGEGKVIDVVRPAVAFDVGAHKGEWAQAVLERSPGTRICCFEIIPSVAARLRDGMAGRHNVDVFDFGLSSVAGDVEVFWNKTLPDTSSLHVQPSEFYKDAEVERIAARVRRGDDVVRELGIEQIDLLKMDVEGNEVEVLQGFDATLRSQRPPKVIQFEYGPSYIGPRHTLHEVYGLLGERYEIGRIYPTGVEFKPYDIYDDHFRMGNYVAVLKGHPLKGALARFK